MLDLDQAAALPKVFAARVDGQTVVLDVARDRYFLARPSDASIGTPHEAQGRSSQMAVLASASARARHSAWASRRPDLIQGLHALRRLSRVQHDLDVSGFEHLVERVRGAPVRSCPRRPRIEDLLASFTTARPFFSHPNICRLDAPALCLLMRRYGHAARLVFGVRLNPFGAHCWVEVQDLALEEPMERIREYTPIMVV